MPVVATRVTTLFVGMVVLMVVLLFQLAAVGSK
jgi:hypothetical protein